MTPGGDPQGELPLATRERVVEALSRHFANDQLTEAQLEVRLQRVYAATTTPELDAVLADLPATATVPLKRAAETRGTTITAVLSGQETKLVAAVPRQLKLRARLGYVELDLTGATFLPGLTTIDVRAFMGYVQIRLPAGVRVESAGHALLGFFSLKGAEPAEAGNSPQVRAGEMAPTVHITGRALCGFAEAVSVPGTEHG